jgi:hypothetical protein
MNRRHITRVKYSEWASLSYYDQILFGDIENLSLQGLFFKTDQLVPVNSLVKISTPYSQISLNANVVRHDIYGMGLKIIDIKLASFISLKQIISEQFDDKETYLQETNNIVLRLHPAKTRFGAMPTARPS